MIKIIFILLSSMFLANCTDNKGGGVTTEETPKPPITDPTPPVIIPESNLNLILSELYFEDLSANRITSVEVGSMGRLVFIARDQFGNKMKGLDIKLGLQFVVGYDNIQSTEIDPGTYVISVNFPYQGFFSGYISYKNSILNIDNSVAVSYCNSQNGPGPFHSQSIIDNETYNVICSPTQLNAISMNSAYTSQNFILGKDIDLTDYYIDLDSNQIPDNQFSIGSSSNPFSGKFLGSGFSINGFKIKSTNDNIGLFSVVSDNAMIDSINLINAEISGNNSVGFIGKIENTSATITIRSNIISSSSISGTTKVGGLIGEVQNSGTSVLIERNLVSLNFNFNGTTTNHSQIGGLIGLNVGGEVLENTVFSDFTYTDNLFLISKLGGLIGEETSFNNSKISLSTIISNQTYSKGSHVGCLIGHLNQGIIKNITYGSSCSIDQTNVSSGSVSFSGGLVGRIDSSVIENLNSQVIATNIYSDFGGVAGYIDASILKKINITGSIQSTSSNISGISASVTNSNFEKISSFVSITNSSGNNISGIISNSQNNILTKISSLGQISASNSSLVGGIISYATGTLDLSDSYHNGSISGLTIVSGILAASSDNSLKQINRVYSQGSIVANSYIGGLIGMNDSTELSINDSFSVSSIQNNLNQIPANSGALIGDTISSNRTSTNNYYLSEATIVNSACSGSGCASFLMIDTNTSSDLATDLAYYMSSLNSPLSNWNFNLIWNTYSSNLPYLR